MAKKHKPTKAEKEATKLKRMHNKKERVKADKERFDEFMEYLEDYQRENGTSVEFYKEYFKFKKRLNKTKSKTFRTHRRIVGSPTRIISNYTSGPRVTDLPIMSSSLFMLYVILLGYFERNDMEMELIHGIERKVINYGQTG